MANLGAMKKLSSIVLTSWHWHSKANQHIVQVPKRWNSKAEYFPLTNWRKNKFEVSVKKDKNLIFFLRNFQTSSNLFPSKTFH
jgi:hypothetical protein